MDAQWVADRILSGLSTGEGLIWHLDEPNRKKVTQEGEKQNEGSRKALSFHPDDCTPASSDKRFLVIEEEFSSTLRVMKRDGSILSPVIRRAFDGDDLQTMSKHFSVKATGAHVSIIAHVTRDDLRRDLTKTEMANGFANRFLWPLVRRSKALPEGGRVPEEDMEPLVSRLKRAVEFARAVGLMQRDEAARELWIKEYLRLSSDVPGLLGAVLSRAEAQVMRLAGIYALLDQSDIVRVEHLQAALAVWDFIEDSARHIFGEARRAWTRTHRRQR